ncbi:MAG: hypothetical protein PHC49_10480 [Desulfuromonadaceae bacterium]|nr:hypothetical protein [Desulfuromonadaceae bacterium]
MKKINLTTYEVGNDPLPQFLRGLQPESLLDLSWTDPALGVSDCAWWPEENADGPIDADTQQYSAEILTVDVDRQVVIVTHEIIALTPETIAQIIADVKAAKTRECDLLAKSKRDAFTSTIAAGEMASWSIKRTEALAYQVSLNAADAPSLQAEAEAREITLSLLVDKVMAKANQLSYIEAQLAGINGKHNDAITALATAAEARAYDVTVGWPL